MTNERERQTYFGAVNISTGQCLIQAHKKGDGENNSIFRVSNQSMS